jgi:hypothetical protein
MTGRLRCLELRHQARHFLPRGNGGGHLGPFLELNCPDVEAEDVAAETSDVFEENDTVEDDREVPYHVPQSDPAQGGEVSYPRGCMTKLDSGIRCSVTIVINHAPKSVIHPVKSISTGKVYPPTTHDPEWQSRK